MTAADPPRTVVLSNGQGLFSLRVAAAELARRGRLQAFITAGYPTPSAMRLAGMTGRSLPARLEGRRAAIPDDLVRPIWSSELAYHIANTMRRLPGIGQMGADGADLAGRFAYGRAAARLLRRMPAPPQGGIYHYRSGYGHASVAVARARGYTTLCEHSIAHPAVLRYLVDHGGRLPPPGTAGPIDANWRSIARDIARADHVLVNSDFVARSFAHQGWPADRVHVLYRGIDDSFVDALPARPAPRAGAFSLAFAGAFGPRKGADTLATALAMLDDVDWRLDICGSVEPGLGAASRGLLADARVRRHGVVGRRGLGALLGTTEIFVFPTLAEGSARVVFEALAAGCYVITTPNAGSIVADGVHGAIVPPADAAALAAALRRAAADRARLRATGDANAALTRRGYSQRVYGDRLVALYDSLSA